MPTSLSERRVLTRDGVSLAVTDTGDRDATATVIFLHGLCLTRESWTLQCEALRKHWGESVRIISYDHRGHGESNFATMSTYRVEQLATDLTDVLRALDVRGHITLVGHSMGGMAIIAYMGLHASERPVEPKSLVLVATSAGNLENHGVPRLLKTGIAEAMYYAAALSPERITDTVIRASTSLIASFVIKNLSYASDVPSKITRLTAALINDTSLRTKAGFILGLKRYDKRGVLSTIGVPVVTVVSGGKDYLIPKYHSDGLARGITGAVHLHFPELGHMIIHENPSAVTAAIQCAVTRSVKLLAAV